MPRRSSGPPVLPARLTSGQIRLGIDRLDKVVARVRQFDPKSITEQYNTPEADQLSAAIDDALVRTFGKDTVEHDRYHYAIDFDNGPHNCAYEVPIQEVQQSLARSKARNTALLEQALESLKERLAEQESTEQLDSVGSKRLQAPSRKVFVVHGHDEAALQAVARFLEQLGLEAIILREQPDRGRTIIEKFEDCAGHVGFAVVLLTPDDIGGAAAATASATRARQNVIFELGYFAGKLGRGRACLLRKGNVEIPSDLYGVIYNELDDRDGWKPRLVRELKAVGLDFDANKIWPS